MPKINLRGVGVALVTPFREDESVDYDALSKLVECQIQQGTDYLVVLGTTAETPTLLDAEKSEIVRVVVKQVAKRVPIVLGLGGNNTRKIVDQLSTNDWGDVDAILSVVPYYNKPSQEGIYQHFGAICKASPLPVILYNVPGRTGVNMTAETTLRLANEFENVIAIKEASGNMLQIESILDNRPDHFDVISGDDSLTFSMIKMGASGVISVIGNAFPENFNRMVKYALAGEYEQAEIINCGFEEIYDLLFVEGNPGGVKRMLSLMGLAKNRLRLPLVPVSESTGEKIEKAWLSYINKK